MINAEVEVGGPGNRGGNLLVPDGAAGTVVFAHGSGSSRHSPRNRRVADALNADGLGTLLFDLLSPGEESQRHNVFDIDLLSNRLAAATRWFRDTVSGQAVAYFGASTGAAAALQASLLPEAEVTAVVSRGGRPDLASGLDRVTVPTLLIVGERDSSVLDLNRRAQQRLPGETRLEVIPGAGHLFEEPGALEQVATLAGEWFASHFTADRDG